MAQAERSSRSETAEWARSLAMRTAAVGAKKTSRAEFGNLCLFRAARHIESDHEHSYDDPLDGGPHAAPLLAAAIPPADPVAAPLPLVSEDATVMAASGGAPQHSPPAPAVEYTYRSCKRTARPGEAPQVDAGAPEIEISSAWVSRLDHAASPRLRRLEGAAADYASDGRLLLLDGLFSRAECVSLVRAAEAVGFGRTAYPKSYRGNLRLITVDDSLAAACWERLRPFVPQVVELDGDVYEAVGLNECWRLAKYHAGDRFGAHVDACFERSPHELSLYTVNVYMNGVPPEAGGATRFFPDAAGKRLGNHQDAVLSVSPEPGLAVVFRQPPGERLLHDGEMLAAGVKYLFRSDVMYRRRARAAAASPGSGGG